MGNLPGKIWVNDAKNQPNDANKYDAWKGNNEKERIDDSSKESRDDTERKMVSNNNYEYGNYTDKNWDWTYKATSSSK